MKVLLSIINIFVLSLVLQAAKPDGDSTTTKNSRYRKSVAVSALFGKVVQTHAFVKGDNPQQKPYENFLAFTGEYGIHTDGRKMWQQLYGYPVWGFGLYKGFLLNDYDELGNPLATYAFFNAPFKRWKRWSLDYNVGFGVSFNWNKHDIIENGYFYPIGTFSTIYFAFGLGANIQISRQLDLYAGLTYTHFSNGAVRLPNLGINLWSPQVSLQYIFNERPEFIRQEKARYLKEWEWVVVLAPAIRQVGFDYDDPDVDTQTAIAFDYAVFTFSSSFNRQFTHLVKFGAGFDLTYNEAYGAQLAYDEDGNPVKGPPLPFGDQLLLGVYPSFELVINRLAMVVQSGFYVYRKDIPVSDVPKTYQRVGLKYHFADHFILGLNIRAYNFSKADFIEWVIGYRIKWQKSYR
ncbi:MAG: acyloxyacyl hydrolase [Bacteroidales bacterium]|nr:acyloxyacyl hydrolase [Bacteroidales bacterium]